MQLIYKQLRISSFSPGINTGAALQANMAQCGSVSRTWVLATLIVIPLVAGAGQVVSAVSSTTAPAPERSDSCLFPNTSMISPAACSHNDSRAMLPRLVACLPYLDEDEAAPSFKCCAGLRNVSALSPPCLCKHTFYPPPTVNLTRGKLMPALCNVSSDLCHVCTAFLVDRVSYHHSWSDHSEEKVSMYKKKVIGLSVVLGIAVACIIVGLTLMIRRKLKQRRTQLQPSVLKTSFQSKHPGSDY